jgi:hypothetical protein
MAQLWGADEPMSLPKEKKGKTNMRYESRTLLMDNPYTEFKQTNRVKKQEKLINFTVCRNSQNDGRKKTYRHGPPIRYYLPNIFQNRAKLKFNT